MQTNTTTPKTTTPVAPPVANNDVNVLFDQWLAEVTPLIATEKLNAFKNSFGTFRANVIGGITKGNN